MDWLPKTVISIGVGFLLGTAVGSTLSGGGKYAEGRLSACSDMLNILEVTSPVFAIVRPECKMWKGDAAISIGGDLFSLDGKTKLN